MIEAKVIADSVSPAGKRITTLQLRYHRFILAEVNTHRAFSRSSASSRAVPVAKMLEQVRNDPATPIHFGKNQAGMQAHEELDEDAKRVAQALWKRAAQEAADIAESMSERGAHKQVVNRLIEPFQWAQTVITATEFDNFYALRCHPDAQPEMQALAYAMRDAMEGSTPQMRWQGDWHLPYISAEERESHGPDLLARISAARCARVSYLLHDGTQPSLEKDLALFKRLAGNTPMHSSPLEHQAQPLASWNQPSRNFLGWKQFRETYEETWQ